MQEIITLTRQQYISDIEDAAYRGAKQAIEDMRTKAEKDGLKPVLVSDLAEKYGYHVNTLLKRVNERKIDKVTRKPVSIHRKDNDELIAA